MTIDKLFDELKDYIECFRSAHFTSEEIKFLFQNIDQTRQKVKELIEKGGIRETHKLIGSCAICSECLYKIMDELEDKGGKG